MCRGVSSLVITSPERNGIGTVEEELEGGVVRGEMIVGKEAFRFRDMMIILLG